MLDPEPVTSLYVHVPFCAQKCSYCAFFSEPSSGEVINRYVEALVRELELVSADLQPQTIFFGGGTPSLLNLRQWRRILETMERLNLLGAREWTVECNPATVSLDKAKLLRAFGVNRVSMGVQSLDEALLDRLGRVHTREMVFKSFDILRQAGFDNLNVDLMFAIPGQTLKIWRETLSEAVALGSEHLSTYEVIYEEDTALYARLQAGDFAEDEDLACAMYEELLAVAAEAGFEQYEVANFARRDSGRQSRNRAARSVWSAADSAAFESAGMPRTPNVSRFPTSTLQIAAHTSPQSASDLGHGSAKDDQQETAVATIPGRVCRHNVNYWRGGSFYGLGPSATGYVRGVRTKNWSNTQLYCEQLERGKRAIESREELSPLARAGETAAFGLRMVAGWPFEQFRRVTGHDLRGEWGKDMEQLAERGWGRMSGEGFHLTSQGLRFADAAAELFLR